MRNIREEPTNSEVLWANLRKSSFIEITTPDHSPTPSGPAFLSASEHARKKQQSSCRTHEKMVEPERDWVSDSSRRRTRRPRPLPGLLANEPGRFLPAMDMQVLMSGSRQRGERGTGIRR